MKKCTETYTVKTGFLNFVKEPTIAAVIKKTVKGVTQMSYEASKLINVFLLDRLEKKLPIPNLDQTFFYQAISTVSVYGNQEIPQPLRRNADLTETFRQLYLSQRPEMNWPNRDQIGQVCNYVGKEMLTNATNHVTMNFVKRLRRWLFCKVSCLSIYIYLFIYLLMN